MNRRQFVTSAIPCLAWTLAACGRTNDGRLSVFVSILPMKYFVERIGGERVSVNVMVGPGQNPATYEPLPRQMLALANTDIFFRIGVPFEEAWIDTIRRNNPSLAIVDLREGIELHAMYTVREIADAPGGTITDEISAAAERHDDHDHGGGFDPHIWLSPLLVKQQAETIYNALCELEPSSKDLFRANLIAFKDDLDRLHDEIALVLESLKMRRLMVFHPAWGYFTREFGLSQLPIEIEGNEPGPRELALVIGIARNEGIKVIFVQSQFSTDTAQAVAEAIDGAVVAIDPLAENYIDNLRDAARTIVASLGGTAHDE